MAEKPLPLSEIPDSAETKTTVAFSNYGAKNTPEGIEKAANFVLKIAAAGVIIGGILIAPPLSLAVGTQIIMYSGVAGTMIKTLSKLFGVVIKE